ncbi:hypothetical protein [Vreelandella venusta]|uniref:hypothetical protein n=1 Tax=Vreelandella venusta TaxID=44935 RepID=UPI003AA80FB5
MSALADRAHRKGCKRWLSKPEKLGINGRQSYPPLVCTPATLSDANTGIVRQHHTGIARFGGLFYTGMLPHRLHSRAASPINSKPLALRRVARQRA